MDFDKLEYSQWAKVAGRDYRLMVIDWDKDTRKVRLFVSREERIWVSADMIEDQPTDFSNGTN